MLNGFLISHSTLNIQHSRSLLPLRSCRRRRSWCGCLPERSEVHFRRCGRSGDAAEVRLRFESAESRDDICREPTDGGVVLLDDVVVSLALHGDAVLSAFELRLQLEEVLIRFQIWIA